MDHLHMGIGRTKVFLHQRHDHLRPNNGRNSIMNLSKLRQIRTFRSCWSETERNKQFYYRNCLARGLD